MKRKLSHIEIIDYLIRLELVVDNKVIKFATFKRMVDTRTYGYRRNSPRIHFIGEPNKLMIGFYPPIGETKAENIKTAYKMLVDLVDGAMHHYDNDFIQFGNSGIPISYKDISFNGPVPEPKPLMGLERYPEFKGLVKELVLKIVGEINTKAPKIESEMKYKAQFVLEEVAAKLEELV